MADGYNFYFATTAALVTNSYLFKTMPYNPQKEFVPVAFVVKTPFAVLVKAGSGIANLQKLIAKSKAAPGTRSLTNEGRILEPGGSIDQIAGFLRDEHQRWAEVAKEIDLLPE